MNINRQLKDIQSQADKLLSGSPSIDEIEAFDRYNDELKSFLTEHLEEEELLARINAIPSILDELSTENISKNIITVILSFFFSWAISYYRSQQIINKAISNIHDAKGKYASIEFLSRNV